MSANRPCHPTPDHHIIAITMERPDEVARRASDNRFRRGREALLDDLERLLGARHSAEIVHDADRAAAIAAEASTGHREAAEHDWALARHVWLSDDRTPLVTVLHAISTLVGPRPVWLIVPGREPQVVALTSDVVLDNPLGFAALAGFELVLLDRDVPAGLSIGRHVYVSGLQSSRYAWELEAWGGEPWLSATTRALREHGNAAPTDEP